MIIRYILVAVFLGLSVSAVNADDELIKSGRDIAAKHCTRCHVVGDINPRGGISSTPSFQLLVTALSDWRDRFETFHARRPHPAVIRFEGFDYEGNPPTTVPIVLKLKDVEALLAFVETFKKK